MPISYDARNKRWRFHFDRFHAGKRHRASKLLPKGWDRSEADAFDQKESDRLYKVATGVTKPEPLIDDAVLLYLEERAPALKSFGNIQRELNACMEAYTGRPMSQLAQVAREYTKANITELAPATIRNRIAYLRSACRYAWKNHGLGEHDPAERLVTPPVDNQRHLYLVREEFIRICRMVPDLRDRAAIKVAFYSGMRADEVQRAVARRGNFDLGKTKNGLPRLVPIHPRVAHIVRNKKLWPIKRTKWTISKKFKAAAIAAGFPDAVLHDLRHSTASEMINAGVDLYTVGGVLGHKSAVSTKRYAHLATATLAGALGAIGRKVKRPPDGPQAKAA